VAIGSTAATALGRPDRRAFGPEVGTLELTAGDSVVVVGPDTELEVIVAGELRAHLRASGPGRYVVFDPAPLRRSLAARRAESTPTTLDERRSA
jgi:hypothetical protein